MLTQEQILAGLEIYERHVRRYDLDYRQADILPKNQVWRPYRWCSKDIVFALTVVQHDRRLNRLNVDVCLTSHPPQYSYHSGAKTAMMFLLAEAYKCGGSMEIAFTRNVEGGKVPESICELAEYHGIQLNHISENGEGHISPFESRQFFMKLTGFSDIASERIMELAIDKKISAERVGFIVSGGLWSVEEAEMVILTNPHPETSLLSLSSPDERHLYLNDIITVRSAVFGGDLDFQLLKKEVLVDGQPVDSEDEKSKIAIAFDPVYYSKVYLALEDINLPWLNFDMTLRAGDQLVAMIRARSSNELLRYFETDLEDVSKLVERYSTGPDTMFCMVVPRDFEEIPVDRQQEMIDELNGIGAWLMVSPKSIAGLNKEAMNRLETGRILRNE